MTSYTALLRAVNLGGSTQVPMAWLRSLLEAMGFTNVTSILQSGNAVFESDERRGTALEPRIEASIARWRGRPIEVFVRSAAEWDKLVAQNPFPTEAVATPGYLQVAFLKSTPAGASYRALERTIVGRERIRAGGRHAYVVYPDGRGRSKLTAERFERALGTASTSRNWNTVLKIQRRLSGE